MDTNSIGSTRWFKLKTQYPGSVVPLAMFGKCTRLTHLLSFASLFQPFSTCFQFVSTFQFFLNFSHFSQLFTNLFLVRLFSGVSLCDGVNCLMKHTQIHSHYICKVFLQCAFYCGFSMWLPDRSRNHIGHICWVFLHCVFFCGLAMYLFVQKIIHTGHTCSVSHHCSHVTSQMACL